MLTNPGKLSHSLLLGRQRSFNTFNGDQAFHFTDSEITKGATTFIQEEQFSGLLAFIVGDCAIGKMRGLMKRRVRDLKGLIGILRSGLRVGSKCL